MKANSANCAVLVMAAIASAGCGERGQRYLAKGNQLYQRGQYQEASINYRKALQSDPNFGEAYYRLGMVEAMLGHASLALAAAARASELLPHNDDAQALAAELYLTRYQAGRDAPAYAQVNKLASELLQRNPRSFAALRLKGYLAVADGKTLEALDFFTRANHIRPLIPDVATSLTGALLLEGRDSEAVALGRSLIAAHPDAGAIYDTLYAHYVKTGDLTEAERILLLKIKNHPTDAFPVRQLAEHYWRHNQRAQATETIGALLRDAHAFPQAHLLIGDFYRRVGAFDESLRAFDQGASAHPQEKTLYQQRAIETLIAGGERTEALERIRALLAAEAPGPAADNLKSIRAAVLLASPAPGERRQAVSDLEELVRKSPDRTDWHFSLGRAYTAASELAQARREFEIVVRRDSANSQAWLALAAVSALARDFSQSRKYADEALRRDPSLPSARLLRARALTGLGQYEQAGAEYNQLIEEYPAYREAHLEHALVAVAQAQYAAAEKEFRANYDPAHGDFRALEGLLAVDFSAGRPEKAWQLVETQHAAWPDALPLAKIRAAAAARAGHWQAAILDYERLSARQPEDAATLVALGDAYQHAGDWSHSIAPLEHARALRPGDWQASFLLGCAYQMTAKPGEAEQAYRQALRLNPGHADTLNNLSFLLAETRQDAAGLDEAAAMAQQAVRASGGSVESTDTLGWIYFKQNRIENARRIYTALAQRSPTNAPVHYHYALALRQMGDRAASARELQAALQNGLPAPDREAARHLLAVQ